MGKLVEGVWTTIIPKTKSLVGGKKGESQFRNFVTRDGSSGFPGLS